MAIQVREQNEPRSIAEPRSAHRGGGAPHAPPALEARDVRKVFRVGGRRPPAPGHVRAIDGVSLRVDRGEIYGLLGANGSGKSTLIRVFSTLLTADAGEVRVFGLDVRADELAVKRLINRVSVEASFFKKLSAMENLVYAGRLYGVGPEASRPRIHAILRRLGIDAGRVHEPLEKLSAMENLVYAGRLYGVGPEASRPRIHAILRRLGIDAGRVHEPLEKLSRGMQQKIAIARAFLSAPMLLLLDEPTTGLDIRSKREVQTFVRDLRDEHDATILLTTHDLDEASRLADRIGILHGGRLVAEGASEELIARHGAASLEDVFMALTGRRIDEADERSEAER